jgi:hypothetical protein
MELWKANRPLSRYEANRGGVSRYTKMTKVITRISWYSFKYKSPFGKMVLKGKRLGRDKRGF